MPQHQPHLLPPCVRREDVAMAARRPPLLAAGRASPAAATAWLLGLGAARLLPTRSAMPAAGCCCCCLLRSLEDGGAAVAHWLVLVLLLWPGLLPPTAAVKVGRVRAACVYSSQQTQAMCLKPPHRQCAFDTATQRWGAERAPCCQPDACLVLAWLSQSGTADVTVSKAGRQNHGQAKAHVLYSHQHLTSRVLAPAWWSASLSVSSPPPWLVMLLTRSA